MLHGQKNIKFTFSVKINVNTSVKSSAFFLMISFDDAEKSIEIVC